MSGAVLGITDSLFLATPPSTSHGGKNGTGRVLLMSKVGNLRSREAHSQVTSWSPPCDSQITSHPEGLRRAGLLLSSWQSPGPLPFLPHLSTPSPAQAPSLCLLPLLTNSQLPVYSKGHIY